MSPRSSTQDPWWVKALVLSLVAVFLSLILVLPLVSVFAEALRQGLGPALEAMSTVYSAFDDDDGIFGTYLADETTMLAEAAIFGRPEGA